MSASLVGSEMCIRDRVGGASGVGNASGELPPSSLRGASEEILGSFWEAVSYTHLTLPTICSV
eukprot:2615498-Alexandrium_andersonii.AAC.1